MRGVRTRGTAGNDRREWYGATDQHRLDGVSATLGGVDLGALADVWPPVRFGFSSTPRTPSIVTVTTTIRRDGRPPAAEGTAKALTLSVWEGYLPIFRGACWPHGKLGTPHATGCAH